MLNPFLGKWHSLWAPALSAQTMHRLAGACTAHTRNPWDKIWLSAVSIASHFSNMRNIPSLSRHFPVALPRAPLTIPRRVEMLDNTAIGMSWVYSNRPGAFTSELSCTSNIIDVEIAPSSGLFSLCVACWKTNIFCPRDRAKFLFCRRLMACRSYIYPYYASVVSHVVPASYKFFRVMVMSDGDRVRHSHDGPFSSRSWFFAK